MATNTIKELKGVSAWRYVLMAMLMAVLASCGETAKLPISASTGPQPTLPQPNRTLRASLHVVHAQGWPADVKPIAGKGLQVNAFAIGLSHPRWLYALPNGDALMAETNAPAKPEDGKGVKGWLMGLFMSRAGAGGPSANHITMLRDAHDQDVAAEKSVLLQGLNSPFGMVLVGSHLCVADFDAVLQFPYTTGVTHGHTPGVKVVDLPAGPINHHGTKNIIASADGKKLCVTVGPNSNVGERGAAEEAGRALIWNAAIRSGHKVIFVPFVEGRPQGRPLDALTGFLSEEGHAYGRPVGVALDKQGALLIADDVGNVVWRISAAP